MEDREDHIHLCCLDQKLPQVEKRDFQHFTFIDEATTGMVPPKDVDADVDTT